MKTLSCMNFPMTNIISLTGHATEFWYVGCQREGFLVEIDVTGRVESWVQEPLGSLIKRKIDFYHRSRQVISYTSRGLGQGGSGEHDPKGCLPFSKLICDDFNISLVFAFGLFGDLWVVNQWDINIRNTRGIELWTSARRMYLNRSTNTLSL